jgi:ABC-type polysaccharide/polyol phosphate export permease
MFLLFYNLLEGESTGISILNIWIIMIFINLFILSLGMSLILSTIYIVAKDISQIWMAFTSFLFFLSPIFYKLSTFKQALPSFDYGNPIAGIIINARRVMMEQSQPDFRLMAFDFGYAAVLLLIGILFLNRLGSRAAEKL